MDGWKKEMIKSCIRAARKKIEDTRKTLRRNSKEYDDLSAAMFCLDIIEDLMREN